MVARRLSQAYCNRLAATRSGARLTPTRQITPDVALELPQPTRQQPRPPVSLDPSIPLLLPFFSFFSPPPRSLSGRTAGFDGSLLLPLRPFVPASLCPFLSSTTRIIPSKRSGHSDKVEHIDEPVRLTPGDVRRRTSLRVTKPRDHANEVKDIHNDEAAQADPHYIVIHQPVWGPKWDDRPAISGYELVETIARFGYKLIVYRSKDV